jgi:hypothetical protein
MGHGHCRGGPAADAIFAQAGADNEHLQTALLDAERRAAAAEARADQLAFKLARLRRPFWRWWFRGE